MHFACVRSPEPEVGGIIISIIAAFRAQALQLEYLAWNPNSAFFQLNPWDKLLSHFMAQFSHPWGRTSPAHLKQWLCS